MAPSPPSVEGERRNQQHILLAAELPIGVFSKLPNAWRCHQVGNVCGRWWEPRVTSCHGFPKWEKKILLLLQAVSHLVKEISRRDGGAGHVHLGAVGCNPSSADQPRKSASSGGSIKSGWFRCLFFFF